MYDSWEQSMDDHTQLFVQGVDWNPALYEKSDYGHQLSGSRTSIARCRLCDRPRLCAKIIQVIETYQLNQYDRR